jgi:hypothetical protein
MSTPNLTPADLRRKMQPVAKAGTKVATPQSGMAAELAAKRDQINLARTALGLPSIEEEESQNLQSASAPPKEVAPAPQDFPMEKVGTPGFGKIGAPSDERRIDTTNMSKPLGSMVSYHKDGGDLDPDKVNVVGEEGPEAIVDNQVIPLDQSQDRNPLGTIAPVDPRQQAKDDVVSHLMTTAGLPDVNAVAPRKAQDVGLGSMLAQPSADQIAADSENTGRQKSPDQLQFQKNLIANDRANAGGEIGKIGTAQVKQAELERANPFGSEGNHPGVFGKILHGLAKAGNIAGDVLLPGATSLIPGTDLNRMVNESQGFGRIEAAEDLADKKSLRDERDNKPTPVDADRAKTITTDKGILQWNPKTGRYDIPAGGVPPKETKNDHVQDLIDSQAKERQLRASGDIAGADAEHQVQADITNAMTAGQKNEPKTDKVERLVNGRTHTILVDAATGADIRDLGVKKDQADPNAVGDRQDRGKAELEVGRHYKGYADANKQIEETRADLEAAADGNQVAASLAPLEGTLLVTSNAGIKRINKNELDLSQPNAGSIVRHAQSWFDKKISGALPDGYVADMNALLDLYKKSNEAAYRENVDSTNSRYGLEGKKSIPYGLKERGNSTTKLSPAAQALLDKHKEN